MPNPSFHHPRCRCVAGLAFVLAASVASASEPDRSPANLRLTVAPEFYAVGPTRFKNVASVQSWLLVRRDRVGAIDRCAATADPRLAAAVERLYPPPGEVLELRSLPAAAPDCTTGGAHSGEARGFLRDEDYLETDESGRSLIP